MDGISQIKKLIEFARFDEAFDAFDTYLGKSTNKHHKAKLSTLKAIYNDAKRQNVQSLQKNEAANARTVSGLMLLISDVESDESSTASSHGHDDLSGFLIMIDQYMAENRLPQRKMTFQRLLKIHPRLTE